MAIDLSPTKAGLAFARNGEKAVEKVTCPPSIRGADRLLWWIDALEFPACSHDLVVLEGPAYGRSFGQHMTGEVHGVVKGMLRRNMIPYAIVAPTQLKKFATGKGNASKDLVLAEAKRQLIYEGKSTDEADALWLLEMALQAYSQIGRLNMGREGERLTVVTKVKWPMTI